MANPGHMFYVDDYKLDVINSDLGYVWTYKLLGMKMLSDRFYASEKKAYNAGVRWLTKLDKRLND